jgi:hypothetical protein
MKFETAHESTYFWSAVGVSLFAFLLLIVVVALSVHIADISGNGSNGNGLVQTSLQLPANILVTYGNTRLNTVTGSTNNGTGLLSLVVQFDNVPKSDQYYIIEFMKDGKVIHTTDILTINGDSLGAIRDFIDVYVSDDLYDQNTFSDYSVRVGTMFLHKHLDENISEIWSDSFYATDDTGTRWLHCVPSDNICSGQLICNTLTATCLNLGARLGPCEIDSDCVQGYVCDRLQCHVASDETLTGKFVTNLLFGSGPPIVGKVSFPRVLSGIPSKVSLSIVSNISLDAQTVLETVTHKLANGFDYSLQRDLPFPNLTTSLAINSLGGYENYGNKSARMLQLTLNNSIDSEPVYGFGITLANGQGAIFSKLLDQYGYRISDPHPVSILTPSVLVSPILQSVWTTTPTLLTGIDFVPLLVTYHENGTVNATQAVNTDCTKWSSVSLVVKLDPVDGVDDITVASDEQGTMVCISSTRSVTTTSSVNVYVTTAPVSAHNPWVSTLITSSTTSTYGRLQLVKSTISDNNTKTVLFVADKGGGAKHVHLFQQDVFPTRVWQNKGFVIVNDATEFSVHVYPVDGLWRIFTSSTTDVSSVEVVISTDKNMNGWRSAESISLQASRLGVYVRVIRMISCPDKNRQLLVYAEVDDGTVSQSKTDYTTDHGYIVQANSDLGTWYTQVVLGTARYMTVASMPSPAHVKYNEEITTFLPLFTMLQDDNSNNTSWQTPVTRNIGSRPFAIRWVAQ